MFLRGSKNPDSSRGTVSLVALCFVAVLGISLAGYISVCSRAMTLSNRSFQGNLSQQLAELGLEEALRAFNKNDWSDWSNGGVTVNWDTSTYAASKRAVASVTFSAGKFAQGTSATVKVRVDNYDAAVLGASWSSSASYQPNELVSRSGTWYRSLTANSNVTPISIMGTGYVRMRDWAAAPVPTTWSSGITYKSEDVVYYATNNKWFRYINGTATAGNTPPAIVTSNTYWTQVPNFTTFAAYSTNNDIISYPLATTWYRWDSSLGWQNAEIAWRWRSGANYSFNDVVFVYNTTSSTYTWWRCINPHTSSGATFAAGSNWENALTGMWGWSASSINYNLGDVVYYSSTNQWYRCIQAHTSSGSITPASTTYWSNTPPYSTAWAASRRYSQYDTARYNGVWYLSLLNTNIAQNPSTATTYWIGANTTDTNYTWNAATSYAAGAYRCYGGVWYKCLANHTNKSPNDTTYWTAAWANAWGITTGAPVAYAEATVAITGNPPATTQLRAALAPAPLFPNAAGAATDLTISTAGGTVDSYDSNAGAYGGTNVTNSAVLAAGSTLTIGGATTVKGYLAWPSPPSGISNGTTLNGVSFSTDKSRVSRSPYVPQFDPQPAGSLNTAFTSANFPKGTQIPATPPTTLNLGTPGATTPSRYYYDGSLDVGSAYSCSTININGPVILYINGYLRIRSGGVVTINSPGSAEIHVNGGIRTDSSSGGYNNLTLEPEKLILISDVNSGTTQSLSATTNPFYGVVYVPKTTDSAGLAVGTGVTLYGALSAKKITFNSEATLHYDTSLRYATLGGVDQPYAVAEWRPLPTTEQATMP